MASVNQAMVHQCKEISVSENSAYSEALGETIKWITISFDDDYTVDVFDRDLEDLRAALYRHDMEVYNADSA